VKLLVALALAGICILPTAPASAGYSWRTYAWTGQSSYTRALFVRHAQDLRFRLSYQKTSGRVCKPSITVMRKGFTPHTVKVKPLYSGNIIRTGTFGLRASQSGGARYTFVVSTNDHCRTRLSVRR
jgi:hypothetical protein